MTPEQLAEIKARANATTGEAAQVASVMLALHAFQDVPALLAVVERIQEWAASDVVTAKSSFGDGYREAMRDIRDLIAGGAS